MSYRKFFKYNKLNSERRTKDNIHLLYKRFLDIFVEEDRIKIVNFLLTSSKILIFVPLVSFTILYFILGLLCSFQVLEGVFFSGFISILHTIISIESKFRYSRIDLLKKDLQFALRIIVNGKGDYFVIQKMSFELLNSTLIYSAFPYFLSVIILFSFVNQSIWILLFGFLFISLNYLIGLSMLIIKIVPTIRRYIQVFLTITIAGFIIILIQYFNLNRILTIKNQITEIFSTDRISKLDAQFWISISLVSTVVILLSLLIYCVFKYGKIISAIFISKEDGLYKNHNNKVVYQRLLLRGFSFKNKMLYIRIGSFIATLLLVILYPILNHYSSIPLVLIILFLCYSPSLLNLMITHYMYDEILQKPAINTTFYFLKKFQCEKYLYKQTILSTFSQLVVVMLPFLTTLLLYRPINVFAGAIFYTLILFTTVIIAVTRVYGLGKYSFEEINILDPSILTSKPAENYIVFGIPIVYAIPLVAIVLDEYNLFYFYISTSSYLFLLIIYCMGKIYLFLFKEKKNVKDL